MHKVKKQDLERVVCQKHVYYLFLYSYNYWNFRTSRAVESSRVRKKYRNLSRFLEKFLGFAHP